MLSLVLYYSIYIKIKSRLLNTKVYSGNFTNINIHRRIRKYIVQNLHTIENKKKQKGNFKKIDNNTKSTIYIYTIHIQYSQLLI